MFKGGGSGSSSPSNSNPGTPTKNKYEQGDKMDLGDEDKAEKKSLAKSTSSGAISAGDTALVDLLETEVISYFLMRRFADNCTFC